MRNFTCVQDIGPLDKAVAEALEVKANRYAYKHLGENRTMLMLFFNSSLRTRHAEGGNEPGYERDSSRR